MNTNVENIQPTLKEFVRFTHEFLAVPINDNNVFLVDYIKSYDEIADCIEYAKEVEQLKDVDKVAIECEITGYYEDGDVETVTSNFICYIKTE